MQSPSRNPKVSIKKFVDVKEVKHIALLLGRSLYPKSSWSSHGGCRQDWLLSAAQSYVFVRNKIRKEVVRNMKREFKLWERASLNDFKD